MTKTVAITVQKNNTKIKYLVPFKCLSQKQKEHLGIVVDIKNISLKINSDSKKSN
tara:strand:+ start:759 stop:923 length:165 start_codon:yes stop_codon:yes gene_type:complete